MNVLFTYLLTYLYSRGAVMQPALYGVIEGVQFYAT